MHKWAFASLRRSAWAREFYDTQRARGKNHHSALVCGSLAGPFIGMARALPGRPA